MLMPKGCFSVVLVVEIIHELNLRSLGDALALFLEDSFRYI